MGVPVIRGDVRSLHHKVNNIFQESHQQSFVKVEFRQVLAFLQHDVELCQPSYVHICDGSDDENRVLLDVLQAEGIIQPLPKYENWYQIENFFN